MAEMLIVSRKSHHPTETNCQQFDQNKNIRAFFLEKLYPISFFSAPRMASTILAGNLVYESILQQFLKPAVGSHPRWVLCYRASSHGWAASIFHRRCDGKRNTVSIIKVGQYVFGGYTDISWGKRISFPYSLI